jgi:glycosyltransferase involved in cell wall biosynthesis
MIEEIGFSVAILSGEIRNRIPMTIKSIESINNQNYKNLQKILVNGGSPPHQTAELENYGVNLADWTILDFPIDAMDAENNWNMQRWNGLAALHAASKEFFFTMNDDDLISPDFFEKIAFLLKKYPSADTGIGLRVGFDHKTNSPATPTYPKNKNGDARPEFEAGIEVIREIFFRNNLGYGPSLGFQPVCRTNLVREAGPGFFYQGIFPDCSSYFQVVSRGDMVFERNAIMYWGIHESQDHNKWHNKNYWFALHEKIFTEALENNLNIFAKYLPNNHSDINNIEKYFLKRIVSTSLFSLTHRFSVLSLLKRKKSKKLMGNQRFPLFKHLRIILKRPRILLIVIRENLKYLK